MKTSSNQVIYNINFHPAQKIFGQQNLMQLYFLLCTFFSVVIGLHLQSVNYLNNNSLYFQQQFTQIIAQVDYVTRTLNLNDSKKFQFLIGKANQVKEGLTALKKCLQKNNLLINKQIPLCPRVSTFNRSVIRRYIIYIEEKQLTMKQYVSTCVDCKFIKKDIDDMKNTSSSYIREVNDTLNGLFCVKKQLKQQATGMVDLNLSYFRNNLESQNWYYGSTTLADYKIYLFKRAVTYNLTSCPITTPFVRGNQQTCFNCPQGSLFNLGNQSCDSCPTNEILNIEDSSCSLCLGEKININGSLQCRHCKIFQGELFNNNTGSCYKCQINSYLDYEARQCISISCDPKTPRFNIGTKKCQACGISQIIDPNDPTTCLKTNYVAVCPPERIYYNKKDYNCYPCPVNTQYHVQSGLCK